ncbi:hypothetical protein V8D89_005569 [Ganoderma adspersum]
MSETVKEQPFTLSVADADLDVLRKKLDLVCFPDELEDAGWDYGVPLAHIKRLVERWRHGYDWRRSEEAINKLPMFTRDIHVDGFGTLNIHYVHQRSNAANAIPLLFVHGWPGHFLESRKLLPILTANSVDKPSFHVVALSLPGYGFSEAPKRRGFAGAQYAEVCNKLMLSLGYNHYGGDWGHVVGLNAVTKYGHRHIKAWHTNCPITDVGVSALLSQPRVLFNMLAYPFDRQAQKALAQTKRHFHEGSGYMIQQATKPQTIGHCLADSPVGLLAWIYEKLVNWSDGYPWSDDEVLEWVSIYWFSRAGPTASARMYYEMTGGNKNFFRGIRWTSVPLGISHFPREVARLPKSWMRLLGNVVFQSDHDKGGHFAAYEQPEKLADDLRKMFGAGGPAQDTFPELKLKGYA